MIRARNGVLNMDTPLEFQECAKGLRDALRRSRFEVITERALDRELRSKLGISIKPYLLFTVWYPMQFYQALLVGEDAGYFASFNVVVSEKERGSTIAAQMKPLLEGSTESLAMKFMARSVTQEMTRLLEEVADCEQADPKSGWGLRLMNLLRGRSKQGYCAKAGGMK